MNEFVVRCNKCGCERSSFNDPRLRRSVIECKTKCFESHYEWSLVNVILLQPPDAQNSNAWAVQPAVETKLSSSLPTTEHCHSLKEDDFLKEHGEDSDPAGDKPAQPKVAFADGDERRPPLEEKKWCTML